MKKIPKFMKHPDNRIKSSSQYTEDIEDYVNDGIDETQMAIWTCYKERKSKVHSHDYDEYMVCVQGQYCVTLTNQTYVLNPGDELYIQGGITHSGECTAGTRTIHAFGGTWIEKDTK